MLDAYGLAIVDADQGFVPIWAGEGIDLITELSSATELVSVLVSEAEEAVSRIDQRSD